MSTRGHVGELVTSRLRERVDRLESAVEDDNPDFTRITGLADAVAELADTVAEIYNDLEQTLMQGLQRDPQSDTGRRRQRQSQTDDSRGGQRQREPEQEQEQEQEQERNGS